MVKLPDSMNPSLGGRKARFEPAVIEGSLGKVSTPPSRGVAVEEYARPVSIPVMGRIAAGTPISAIEQHTHTIQVPPEMLGAGDHYALEVRGDSMIEAGIFDGDTVVIRRQDTAGTGEIVVALVDDEEATLKRLRRKGNTVALEAANPAYETRIFPPDRVKVQGRLIGLLRKY